MSLLSRIISIIILIYSESLCSRTVGANGQEPTFSFQLAYPVKPCVAYLKNDACRQIVRKTDITKQCALHPKHWHVNPTPNVCKHWSLNFNIPRNYQTHMKHWTLIPSARPRPSTLNSVSQSHSQCAAVPAPSGRRSLPGYLGQRVPEVHH